MRLTHPSRVRPLSLAPLLMPFLALLGRAESFSWYQPVSGSFEDPNRWQVGANPAENPNPERRLPGGSDRVGFTRGVATPASYEVRIAGGAVDTLEATSFTLPAFTQPLTLRLEGTLTAVRVGLGDQIFLEGSGKLQGGPGSQLFSVRATGVGLEFPNDVRLDQVVLENVAATVRDLTVGGLALGDTLLLRRSTLQTDGTVGFAPGRAVLEDGSEWNHGTNAFQSGRVLLRGASHLGAAGRIHTTELQITQSSSVQAETLEAYAFGGFLVEDTSAIRADLMLLQAGAFEALPSEVRGGSTVDARFFELQQGFLRVSGGSKLRTLSTSLGTSGGGAGLTIAGTNSQWVTQSHLAGGSIRAMDGGEIQLGETAQDVLARVGGGGAVLRFGHLYRRARLIVSPQAQVIGTHFTPSEGGGSIEGPDAVLRLTGTFSLGAESTGPNGFEMISGALLECEDALLSSLPDGSTTMLVAGAGTAWRIGSSLVLGEHEKSRALLNVSDGATVTIAAGDPASAALSVGVRSTVTLSGPGSRLDAAEAGPLRIGLVEGVTSGTAMVTVQGGASLRASSMELGPNVVGEGHLRVTGTGSRAEVAGGVVLGRSSGQGRLEVLNGGSARLASLTVGETLTDNRTLVSGSDSTLVVSNVLAIGEDFGRGTLTIADRGRVTGATPTGPQPLGVGVGTSSEGSLVVDGAGSLLSWLDGPVDIGFQGEGRLTVSGGGELNVHTLNLGYQRSSSGFALVTAEGQAGQTSRILAIDSIVVGGAQESVPATLEVAPGGSIAVGRQVRVRSQGVLNLRNGAGTIGDGGSTPGVLLVARGGTLHLEEGARVRLNGGRLVVRGGQLVSPMATVSGPAGASLARSGPRPAAEAGPAVIEGGLTLEDGGVFAATFAGPVRATGERVTQVTGPTVLGGILRLEFTDGFAPGAGERLPLLKVAGAPEGTWAEVRITGLAEGFRYTLDRDANGIYGLTPLNDGVATSAPRLVSRVSAGQLVLSWAVGDGRWVLQRAPQVPGGSWVEVPSSGGTAAVPISPGNGFFRLIHP